MSTAVRLTFVTAEGRFAGDVPAAGVFHEALEHLLPEALRVGRRVTIRTPAGDAVYPDMFIGETVAHFGTDEFAVHSEPLRGGLRPWRTLGVDHLALAVHDRQDARRLLEGGLGMQVVRDDPHQPVLTTGLTGVFLFDATPGPLNPGLPSRVHHLGFVVDDLDAAWQHVRAQGYASDYMVLERDERWSLYFFYQNGDVRFMIQLSEIKAEQRGFDRPAEFTDRMFDYSRHRYGVRFDDRRS
ncbi:MAG TPA: VOC family protein [bacterium]|nr:VOC family protein [bacterium]